MGDFLDDDDVVEPPSSTDESAPAVVLPDSHSIVFDIETAPCWSPGDHVRAAREYCEDLGICFDESTLGKHPGEFDKDAVKLGRLTDPDKIEAKLKSDEQKHQNAVAKYLSDCETKELGFWNNIVDHAALSPVTGKVLAIGFCHRGKLDIVSADSHGSEELMLTWFWDQYGKVAGNCMTGWNIHGFDVPFLIVRSAKLGVSLPRGLYARGKWLSDTFVDCMTLWGKSYNPWKDRQNSSISAKNAAAFLGVSQRSDDEIEGADFWKYWLGTEHERKSAVDYLMHDVIEETLIAKTLGVI